FRYGDGQTVLQTAAELRADRQILERRRLEVALEIGAVEGIVPHYVILMHVADREIVIRISGAAATRKGYVEIGLRSIRPVDEHRIRLIRLVAGRAHAVVLQLLEGYAPRQAEVLLRFDDAVLKLI